MLEYTPLNYPDLNLNAGTYAPSSIKKGCASYALWQRSLFQRACSVIDLNVPEWTGPNKDFLYWCLFKLGYVGVFYNSKYGLCFQPGTLYGYDLYYQPTDFIVTNPNADISKTYKIHSECELIKLTPDYLGIFDIINYYAEKLANMDNAINMSIINTKFPMILTARNKAAAQALKKVVDRVNKGEPLVIVDSELRNDDQDKDTAIQLYDREHLRNCYVTDQQLQDFQTLLNSFDAEIGIPTVPYQKAERMVTSEAESKTVDSKARATIWLETLNSSLKDVNETFGVSFSAKLRYNQDVKEVEKDGISEANPARD